jgi:bifunctional non-homologous end joining protein LigD
MAQPKSKLSEYERKRSFAKTPEPTGKGKRKRAAKRKPKAPRFVIQEHHARRLHWDLRLEHDGVAVSWALPKGVPTDPKRNNLAVHTEDHPLEYLEFHGEIPKGQYGAGTMSIWDQGTYEAEKFRENEVILTFHGERVQGRYALFQTREDNWMIHRMDPPELGRVPMPEHVKPMLATLASKVPHDEHRWAYELKWDGVRAIAYCQGGRVTLESRNLRDVTSQYPEVRGLGEQLGATEAVLDGEVVTLDDQGRPSFQRLQGRMHLGSESAIRRQMTQNPVIYMIFDVLHLDGESLIDLSYEERRARLESLGLEGPCWQTPRNHTGDGEALLALTRERGIEGIVAKRLDCAYTPGRRSRGWLKVKNVLEQEFVIGGWMPGEGRRQSTIGSLLVGYHEDGALRYAGRVGTGFTEKTLAMLVEKLTPLRTDASPFEGRQPPRIAIFAEPKLVAQIEFREWTQSRTLRAPAFKGLRDDKDPRDVVREAPAA